MKPLKSLLPIPGDNLLLADTEKPGLNRVRASRTRRRLHAVLLVLLVLAACVSLAAGDTADIGNLDFLLTAAFLGLIGPVLYLITRLNQITRMSLPYRLLDERQREEREDPFELLVTVGQDGRVVAANVHKSSGYAAFDEAALDAVRQWRSRPLPRASTQDVIVPILFRIRR